MTRLKSLFEEDRDSSAEMLGHVSCTNIEEIERFDEKNFLNGDIYYGKFKGTLPHGNGTYKWSDGTIYDGNWEEGKMTGKGNIVWPSGAKYDGEFSAGYLHGFGSFIATDGSVYEGTWRMNVQHGCGRKEYCDADVYVGSWREGVHEGSGRYSWSNGNVYIGNWKSGKMCGRGVMKWPNGDVYDGMWSNGYRHGSGIYKFSDGGYYFGMWTKGLKDGKGVFYPSGSKHPPLKNWCTSLGYDDTGTSLLSQGLSLHLEDRQKKPDVRRSLSEKTPGSGSQRTSDMIPNRTYSSEGSQNLNGKSKELISRDPSCTLSYTSDDGPGGLKDHTVVYEREYMQGVLIRENARNYKDLPQKRKGGNKFHAKEVKRNLCFDTFKSKRSYYLMLNLQLGIRYTVGKITPVPRREVRASDFGEQAKITVYFPARGSRFTPPHKSVDFHWKDYCPMVFRNLREMFKLDAAEYMMSICGDDGLREISSPGKSGSIFYVSHDDKFVIKTLKRYELKVLLKMLPRYNHHVEQHENTLITKFFGVHRIAIRGRRKVHFVVMGNMFCTELSIHRRYDLKGSTHGRFTEKDKIKENTTLKDLDLRYEFHMDKLLLVTLFEQLSVDCNFLRSQGIIDYSLLLGVHFRAPEKLDGLLEPPSTENSPAGDGVTAEGELLIPPKGLLLVAHEPSFVSTAPGPHIRGQTLRAYSVGEKEVDVLLPGTGRVRVQLGVNMPAQATQKVHREAEVELFEVYDVVLYMGIIDILQEYNVKKRVEHAYKSLLYDPVAVSVVDPELYAKRFLSFLQDKVFRQQP